MTQNAIVKECVSPGVVRVSLKRQLACGSGCPSCKGCVSMPTEEIFALAQDNIGLKVGEWAEVETNAASSVAISLMVYFLPCLTMLLGYVLGETLGMGEALSLIPAALGVVVGFIPAKTIDKKIKNSDTPEFTVSCRVDMGNFTPEETQEN